MAANLDGFKLSEIDLEIRREGDVLGSNQSGGRSSLRLLRVIQDAKLISAVRGEVEEIFTGDPNLQNHPVLAQLLESNLVAENLSKV